MRNVLVTGGTGFIGRELVRQLINRGDDVTILSRSKPKEKVKWIKADITDKSGLEQGLKDYHFDIIYHTTSLPGDTGNPEEMVNVNINGLLNMLEFDRHSGVQRFVLTSSISAYEWFPATKFRPPKYMPVDENHPCMPQDMYSTTKRMQELLAMTYYYQYKVPVTVLRVTAVIGPEGSGGGRMWRDFAKQMKEGKQIQLPMFSPEELSHFVDLRDVAEMHIVAGCHPNAVGEIFNCCGPKPTRGSEFAEEVKRIVPKAEILFVYPWSMAQGGEIEFDISKMEKLLGYKPKYTLRDSILSIYEWVKSGGLEEN